MMKTLFETDRLVLEHSYESVQLRDKASDSVLYEDEFYGEPECGLIDTNENWAVIAGDKIVFWAPERVTEIPGQALTPVHALRLKKDDENLIEILVDPWSNLAAVWELDTISLETKRVKEFCDQKNKPYIDAVVW